MHRTALAAFALIAGLCAEPQPVPSVEDLCTALRSGESPRQMEASQALAKLGGKAAPAAPDLVKLLDRHAIRWNIRGPVVAPPPTLSGSAANALLKIGPAAHPFLLRALKDGNNTVRFNALYILTRSGVEENLAILAPCAADPSPAVRSLFIESIGHIHSEAGLALRLNALADPVPRVRSYAISGFRWLDPKPDPHSAWQSTEVTDGATLRKVACALLPFLSAPETRNVTAQTLGHLRSPVPTNALIKVLDNPDPWVRTIAARSLGQIGEFGDHRAAPALIECLADPNPTLTIAAIEALGSIHDPLATKPLVRLLQRGPSPLARSQEWLDANRQRYVDAAADSPFP